MGILNITRDSFYDGGLYFDREKAIARGLSMVEEGAEIIDVGGESTRPGSDPIPAAEELRRIVPVIRALREQAQALISVDTTKSDVALAALDAGADLVNDISSGRFDTQMLPLVAQKDVPVILMHMQGIPKTMQDAPYYNDVLAEVKAFLEERCDAALAAGVAKEKIIIDPGIGFGKRFEDNLTLINNLRGLESLGRPICVGVSRKSFLARMINLPPEERLEGTIAASILSILNGAHILRVHDVRAVKRAVAVAEAIQRGSVRPGDDQDGKAKRKNYVH